MSAIGAILLGIACLLIANLVVMPYVLYVVLLIVGVVSLVYGVYLLFVGGAPFITRR